MSKSLEQFDFSKKEDQEKFEQLPKEEQKIHIEKSHEEALAFERERKEKIFIEKSLVNAREEFKSSWSDTHFDGYNIKKSKKFENNDYVTSIVDRTYEDYGAGDSDYNFLIITDKEGKIVADRIGYDKYYNSEAHYKQFNFSDPTKHFNQIVSSTIEKDKDGKEKYILKIRCEDEKEKEFVGFLTKSKEKE